MDSLTATRLGTAPQRIHAEGVARWVTPALALVATLAADIVLAILPHRAPQFASLLFFGLALAQVALAAAWTVLGSKRWLMRFATLALAALTLSALLARHVQPPAAELLGFMLAFAAAVAVPLCVLRQFGWLVASGAEDFRTPASKRFSLRDLFAVTTIVAAYAALVRLGTLNVFRETGALNDCVTFAVTAFVMLAWAALRGGIYGRATVALAVIALLPLWARSESGAQTCIIAAVEATALLLAQAVARMSGRRVAWSPVDSRRQSKTLPQVVK